MILENLSSKMIVRFLAATLRSTALVLWATVVMAQAESPDARQPSGQRFVSVGQLTTAAAPTAATPSYVLLDEVGQVIASLKAAAGVDLDRYLGHEVGVTARTLVDGATPTLLAENVTSFGPVEQANQDPGVRLADYTEEALPEVVGVEDMGPIEFDTGLPSPLYQDSYGSPVCDSCGSDYCGGTATQPCGLPGSFWIRSEYLIWWTEGMRTPALVTTSPAGTASGDAGVLGTPGVEVLYGDEELFSDSRSGGRFRLGKWCDDYHWLGFETDFFFLANEDQNFAESSVGPQIYARPFLNTDDGQDAQLVQYPGIVNGNIRIDADTSLWSIGPRMRFNLACEKMPGCDPYDPCSVGGYRLDLLAGYRYMRLDDRLVVRESLATVDVNNPTYFSLHDSFDSSNDFHGADLGLLWEGYRGPWSLELIGRVGLGTTHQTVSIAGSTTTMDSVSTVNDPGGLLALSSNIGNYSRDEFTVLPEASVTLGYAMSPRTRFLVGYTFIYWNKVVRAGDAIDTTVNPDLIPPPRNTNGPTRPAFAFTDTSFWAQGLSLGMEYRW